MGRGHAAPRQNHTQLHQAMALKPYNEPWATPSGPATAMKKFLNVDSWTH